MKTTFLIALIMFTASVGRAASTVVPAGAGTAKEGCNVVMNYVANEVEDPKLPYTINKDFSVSFKHPAHVIPDVFRTMAARHGEIIPAGTKVAASTTTYTFISSAASCMVVIKFTSADERIASGAAKVEDADGAQLRMKFHR